jgi:KDO2-lipid IV(A) lauroyltransferase
MNLQQAIISDPRIMRLSLILGQKIPERIGHRLAWWASGIVCHRKPTVYRTVQANLSQVLDREVEVPDLGRATRQVFYTAIRGYYDLYRSLRLSLEDLVASVEIPEATKEVARSLWNRERGTVLVVPHLSGFDLCGQALAPLFPETLLLTLPDPPAGFRVFNELRRRSGVQVTPLSSAALRQAIKLLRQGGVVSLAGDRPVSELDRPIPFFGRPARVPSGHVRLALKTNAAVAVGHCAFSQESQRYTVHIDPPRELVRTGDWEEEVWINMRQILDSLEDVIRRWPEQWQMFVPVWPDLLQL